MSHEVPWNKIIVERFVDLAILTKDEEMILRTRVAGWTRTQQSIEFNMSISKVDSLIRTLKYKYDNVQKYDPMLPPRKSSDQERWQDEN